MKSKKLVILGLLLVLVGTGIMGFKIPRKGELIKAPNLNLMRFAIFLIIIGNALQAFGTLIS